MPRWMLVVMVSVGMSLLTGCGPWGLGRIEPISEENIGGAYYHRLSASTNCAEVGEEVVFTAEVTNLTAEPLTVMEQPPLDIIIRPYRPSGSAGGVHRWSETAQYPQDLEPVLAPHETRTYTWRWIADAVYTSDSIFYNGILVDMPVTVQYPSGGKSNTPVPDLVVGVKVHPERGQAGVFCKDMR